MARLTIGASPDPDDVFMVWAIGDGRVDLRGHDVDVVHEEIAVLNRWAHDGKLALTGLSAATWPHVTDKYGLLSSGGSAGEGYGPVLVAKPDTAEPLAGPVAVPGRTTTAYMLAHHGLGDFPTVETPFDRVLHAVVDGTASAGLLIHESQMGFRDHGLVPVFSCYDHWAKTSGHHVLPLGVVTIRTDLPVDVRRDLLAIWADSLRIGMECRPLALEAAMKASDGLDLAGTERYIDMYVNARTRDWGDEGRAALDALYALGAQTGAWPPCPRVAFADHEA